MRSAGLETLSPEEQALIAGSRGEQPPDDTPVQWETVGRLAELHGIEALLHRSWRNSETVPPELRQHLASVSRYNASHGLTILHQRGAVLEILSKAGIQPLVLKGAALARTWYGDLSLRPCGDIDLLVGPAEVYRAQQLLIEAGYQPLVDVEATPTHHDVPLTRARTLCPIEVHRTVTSLPLSHRPTYDELRSRSLTFDEFGHRVTTLGPEDTLVHLCLHLLQHMVQMGGWRLLHVWDVARQVEAFAINWDRLESIAGVMGMGQTVRSVLGLTSLVTGVHIPDGQIDRIRGARLLPLIAMAHNEDLHAHFRVLQVAATLSRGDLRTAFQLIQDLVALRRPEGSISVLFLRPTNANPRRGPFRALRLLPYEALWMVRALAGRHPNDDLRTGFLLARRQREVTDVVDSLLAATTGPDGPP